MKKIVLLISAVLITALLAAVFAAAKMPGDINGDGQADNKDVVALFRYVSGNKTGADEENCDFNGDGEIDNKDVVALFRALSRGELTDTEEETEEETETETEPDGTEEESQAEEPSEEESTDSISEQEPETSEDKPEETESDPEETEKELVIITPGSYASKFVIAYDKRAEAPLTAEADMLANMIRNITGTWVYTADTAKNSKKEIVLCSSTRSETSQMTAELEEGEYAVRVLPGEADGEGKLLIAATTYDAVYTCAEYLLDTYYTEEKGLCVPFDLDVKGKEKKLMLTESTITRKMRDPFVLVEDGVYYVYSTGWKCSKNVSGKLAGPWKKLDIEVNLAHPETDGESHWAPEVHKYNGAYYMFTTYYNSETSHRGCIILRSESPEGPFNEITDGFITPADWDSIDGTFYIDPDGQLWMVFVHEWTSMPDGVGAFAAAKLSDDLTHFISEPIELFKADEPIWARADITDGCFMYTGENKDLYMLWSNFDAFGYSVAVAKSSNGRLDGEWIHQKTLLYSKCMTNGYDGGHAMIFTDTDGQMYIAVHSPNTAADDRKEIPVFVAIEEKDGSLIPLRVEDQKDVSQES